MTSALITAAIILGAIFIFVFLFILIHKKGHNKKLARQKVVLADIIWKNKLEISEKETINDYMLAIDKKNSVLVYIDFSMSKEVASIIDLWNIKTVKVKKEEESIYMQRKWKPVLLGKQTKLIQLEATVVDNEQKTNLVLYEYKDGLQDIVQINRRADYWSHLINTSIQKLPHPSRQNLKYA